MHKQFLFLSLFLVTISSLLCACGTRGAPPLHPRPLGFWENEKAIVQVLHIYSAPAKDLFGNAVLDADGKPTTEESVGFGTGAVVDVNGFVVTNNHVVASDITTGETPSSLDIYAVCTVVNGEKDCTLAQLLATNKEIDLALLKTDKIFPQAINFAEEGELLPGDEVYFWGNVFDYLPPSPFFGHYTGRVEPSYYTGNRFSTKLPLLLFDITAVPGSSGSPVFDRLGRVIAWLNSHLLPVNGERVPGVGIPTSTVRNFLKENMPTPELEKAKK